MDRLRPVSSDRQRSSRRFIKGASGGEAALFLKAADRALGASAEAIFAQLMGGDLDSDDEQALMKNGDVMTNSAEEKRKLQRHGILLGKRGFP